MPKQIFQSIKFTSDLNYDPQFKKHENSEDRSENILHTYDIRSSNRIRINLERTPKLFFLDKHGIPVTTGEKSQRTSKLIYVMNIPNEYLDVLCTAILH